VKGIEGWRQKPKDIPYGGSKINKKKLKTRESSGEVLRRL